MIVLKKPGTETEHYEPIDRGCEGFGEQRIMEVMLCFLTVDAVNNLIRVITWYQANVGTRKQSQNHGLNDLLS